MAASARLRRPNPWSLVCAGVCLLVGVLAGLKPAYGILGALGLMFAVVAIMDVTLGFILFTVASFLDVISGNSSFSGTKVIGLVLFVSWLARVGTRRGTDLGDFVNENPWLTTALLAMLFWAAMSFAWATSPSTAIGGAIRYGLDMIVVPIAYSAIRRREQAVLVVSAFVFGALLSALWGLVSSTATSGLDAGRFTGALGESNAEAAVLAAAIPLIIGLSGVIRGSARLKLAAVAGTAIMFAGLVQTLSREGLVALGAVMVGAVVFGGRWRRKAAALLIVGVVATAGYFVILAPATSLQRVTNSDTSGRSSLWTVAWRVIDDHPLTGVGTDNFILVENRYINRPGAIQALYVVNTPKVTHNTFLEALADLGIPGLVTLVAVLGLCLAAGMRAARTFERVGDAQMELLSRSVVLALVAVLTTDMFVAAAYAKFLWIPLAICPALLKLARRAERERDAETAPADPRPAAATYTPSLA